MNERGPGVLQMVALVAVVVALVILVFFALGYLFGRMFLQGWRVRFRVRMLPLGVFGINNDGLNTAVNVLILVLLVVWVALIFWTFSDARRRIDDPMLVGCATLASVFPFVGTIVYAIIRPPEFLDDVRLRELEMQAAEARLSSFDYQLCPYCDYEVKGDYLRCPSCMRRLKERCYSCGKPIDPAWKLCPFCEAETGAVPPPSARRRRRGGTSEEPVTAAEPPPAG